MPNAAIVLCGGRSRRMGRDKASLDFGPETLLARVVRLVREAVDEVVVVAREDQTVPKVDAPVVRDAAEGLGPLAGLARGLREIGSDRAFLTSCDVPFLIPDYVRRLFELAADHDAVVPLIDGHHMVTSAVYSRSVLALAENLLAAGQLRPLQLVESVNALIVTESDLRDVDPNGRSFLNCNTPREYEQALREAGMVTADLGTHSPAPVLWNAETRSDEFTRNLEQNRRKSFPRDLDGNGAGDGELPGDGEPISRTTLHFPESLAAGEDEEEPPPEDAPGEGEEGADAEAGEEPADDSETLPPWLPVSREIPLDAESLITIGEPDADDLPTPEIDQELSREFDALIAGEREPSAAPPPPADGKPPAGKPSARAARALDRARLTHEGHTLFVYAGTSLQLGRTGAAPGGNDVCLRLRPVEGNEKYIRRISSTHLRVRIEGPRATLSDLGSTGGTVVQGAPLPPDAPLPLPARALVRVASVIDLEVRLLRDVDGVAAVWITRPENGREHSYLLLARAVCLGAGPDGITPSLENGTRLATRDGVLSGAGRPLRAGDALAIGGHSVPIAPILPEDQK